MITQKFKHGTMLTKPLSKKIDLQQVFLIFFKCPPFGDDLFLIFARNANIKSSILIRNVFYLSKKLEFIVMGGVFILAVKKKYRFVFAILTKIHVGFAWRQTRTAFAFRNTHKETNHV